MPGPKRSNLQQYLKENFADVLKFSRNPSDEWGVPAKSGSPGKGRLGDEQT